MYQCVLLYASNVPNGRDANLSLLAISHSFPHHSLPFTGQSEAYILYLFYCIVANESLLKFVLAVLLVSLFNLCFC
jgi:hypothetical protein